MTHTRAPLCLSIALFALAGTAHAGRPLATEDADFLSRGQCEAEGFIGRASASGLVGEKVQGGSMEHELSYLNLVATREL